MTKLNDLQSILLSIAAGRDSGSLYPLAECAAGAGARLTKALATLTKAGFAEERQVAETGEASRIEEDQRFGLFVTAAGLAAIGVVEAGGSGEAEPGAPEAVMPAAKRSSKAAEVVALLSREQGATMPELIEATGWLPHTARAALTGLRKKGHAITRGKRDNATCYMITAATAAAAASA